MCDEVKVGETLCHTQGQLSEALGGDLVMEYGSFDPRDCLCTVDLPATAQKHGYLSYYCNEFADYEFKRATDGTSASK